MRRRPPRSTRTDTLFPYPTVFRSGGGENGPDLDVDGGRAVRASERGAAHLGRNRRAKTRQVRPHIGDTVDAQSEDLAVGTEREFADVDLIPGMVVRLERSEERRAGKECVRTVRRRW